MDDFKDKIAIVTGGASGIGKGLCVELAQGGATVIIADIHVEELEKTIAQIQNTGGKARGQIVDVSRRDEVERLIDLVVVEYGKVDYIFNNAGIAIAGDTYDMTWKQWQNIVNVNFWGVIYGTQIAYNLMKKQGFGHIVNTASTAGLMPFAGITAYTATKHGVVGLSTSLRTEASDFGVNVSVVCPGLIDTNIIEAATLLQGKKETLFADPLPFKAVPASKAAQIILKGVLKNKGVITFPFHAKFLVWLYRHFPKTLNLWEHKFIQEFRRKSKLNG